MFTFSLSYEFRLIIFSADERWMIERDNKILCYFLTSVHIDKKKIPGTSQQFPHQHELCMRTTIHNAFWNSMLCDIERNGFFLRWVRANAKRETAGEEERVSESERDKEQGRARVINLNREDGMKDRQRDRCGGEGERARNVCKIMKSWLTRAIECEKNRESNKKNKRKIVKSLHFLPHSFSHRHFGASTECHNNIFFSLLQLN